MIYVLWPTVRPEIANAGAKMWRALASGRFPIMFYFGVSDPVHIEPVMKDVVSAQSPQAIEKISDNRIYGAVHLSNPAITGVTYCATQMTRLPIISNAYDTDIIILASDDFEAPPLWDSHLIDEYQDNPMQALIVNDGYNKETNIIPIPVVTAALLRRLNGILYHPAYHHFFSDQELYDIVLGIGGGPINLRKTTAPVFRHRHWSFGGRQKDSFDQRNNARWTSDSNTYDARKNMSLEQKLALPEGWR